MRSEVSLPALSTVEAALRSTTEVLASELANPSATAPVWSDIHWRLAVAAAAMHGISPLLCGALRWRGPAHWQRFLEAQRLHTIHRHARIVELLAEIDSRTRRDGISVTALKGAALHDLGIYRTGERPMADIDLLVKPDDFDTTTRILKCMGYEESYVNARESAFVPAGAPEPTAFGEHAGNAVKIELHARIAQRLPFYETEITRALLPSAPHPGINAYASLGHLMLHLLLHAAGNMRMRGIRAVQLHDIASLSARMCRDDWEVLFQAAGAERCWWAFPPLALTARYYSNAIPLQIMAAARSACPRTLQQAAQRQTLSHVSMSNLWIQAFPGIEWAGSVLEALRYVEARAFPNRSSRAEHRVNAAKHAWAGGSAWMQTSHPRRMIRWAFSRPPRVETLSSVRAAWQETSIH